MSYGAGFAQGLDSGQRLSQRLIDIYQASKQRSKLDEIDQAKPVESSGFTPEQGQQIEAVAADGTKHIGYDDKTKAYMATPKLGENEMGPAQPVEIARQGTMTDFLGKRTVGTMTPDQVSSAKFKAMADVVGKTDPLKGMQMQRDIKQGEREDKRWMREDKKATEDDDFQKALQAEFGQTIYGKRIGEYATQVQAYEQYQAKLKSGAAPETLGPAPQMPQRPAYSVGESLADGARLLAFKSAKGKADPAELMQFAERLQKVNDEGYGKALKLAQGGAPLDKVIEQFNQTGAVKLDPAAVVSDQMVPGADGVPARVITVRDQNGKTQTINALSELDAIGQAESYFSRFDKDRGFKLKERELEEVKIRNAETRAEMASMRASIAAARGGGRGGGSAQDGGGTPSFAPYEGFDPKNAQSAATQLVDDAIAQGGKPVTPQERARLISDQVFKLRDAYAGQNAIRQRNSVFLSDSRAAQTPEQIEAVRQAALKRGFTPAEMAALDKRFSTAEVDGNGDKGAQEINFSKLTGKRLAEIAKKPRGISSYEAAKAQEEIDRRKSEPQELKAW